MKIRIAVIAAHPDDEVLGCGGTVAKYAQDGAEVHVLIAAEGVTSRDPQGNQAQQRESLASLATAAKRANEILGVASLTLNDLPDNRMDSIDLLDVVKRVEGYLQRIGPSIVLTHHSGDVNIDHQRLHHAVITACRPIPGSKVERLLFFETASSTEWQSPQSAPAFLPNWFEDIGRTLEIKLNALRAYDSEMRSWPHPRSIEAVTHLARWRGATIGAEAAEAFVLGRAIHR